MGANGKSTATLATGGPRRLVAVKRGVGLLLTALLSAASGDAPAPLPQQPPVTGTQTPVPAASLPAIDSTAPVVRAPAVHIYYDLTQYDWYREGQPLETESGIYEEDGDPVFLPRDSVVRMGTFQGVDYYQRVAGDDSTLLIPVYPSYWLPFSLRGRRGAEARDGASHRSRPERRPPSRPLTRVSLPT